MSLAIFDLDQTLIAGDSDFLWGEFLAERGLVDQNLYKEKNTHFYEEYRLGCLDIKEYLTFSLAPFAIYEPAQLRIWHAEFMRLKIKPILLSKARAKVSEHKKKGDITIVITATNRFIAEPIVKHYNIDYLLATELEIKDGRYTGNITGVPCFQIGKVTQLKKWLRTQGKTLRDSYFYSDSHNDLPLFQLVTHPIATNADDKLRAIAHQNNWQQQNWN